MKGEMEVNLKMFFYVAWRRRGGPFIENSKGDFENEQRAKYPEL